MFRILNKEELEVQQWSSDEKVINPCMNEGDEVVFVNGKGKHIVTQAYRQDGVVVADIPNDFLQHKGNILAYLEQGKDRHKDCETTISVAACEKPSGYKCVKNEKVFPKNQANWNQNDPTKPDYVKNRPFWEENKTTTVFDEIINIVDRWTDDHTPLPITIIAGNVYKVTINGNTYATVAREDGYGSTYIGNVGLWWEEEAYDDGVPFVVGGDTGESACFVSLLAEDGAYGLKIENVVSDVHKIPEKYLPDGIGVINLPAELEKLGFDIWGMLDELQNGELKEDERRQTVPLNQDGFVALREKCSNNPIAFIYWQSLSAIWREENTMGGEFNWIYPNGAGMSYNCISVNFGIDEENPDLMFLWVYWVSNYFEAK